MPIPSFRGEKTSAQKQKKSRRCRTPLHPLLNRPSADAANLLSHVPFLNTARLPLQSEPINVLKSIEKLEPLVSEVLLLPKKEYDKVKRLQSVDEIEAVFPGFKTFLDATEQEILRPKGKRKRKTHYSGKKKKHTVKTQLTVNKEDLII